MAESEPSLLQPNRSFWLNPITVILSSGLLFFNAQLLGSFMAYPFVLITENENIQLFITVLLSLVALLGMLAIAQKVFKLRWQQFGFTKPAWRYVAILPVVFVGYMLATMAVMFLLQKFVPGFNADQAQDIGFADASSVLEKVSMFVTLVVITPLLEEVLFRGVLFRGLRRRLPFWAAAVLASALFAVAHGQWNVAADTFVLSLILCYLTEKSGSILPAILLHAIKNGLAFILLFVVS